MAKAQRRESTGEQNIYQYEDGTFIARLHIGNEWPTSPRYATEAEAIAWRDKVRAERLGVPTPASAPTWAPPNGSLEHYAETWYWTQLIRTKKGFKADQSHLRAWFGERVQLPGGEPRALGRMHPREITEQHVNIVVARWLSEPRTTIQVSSHVNPGSFTKAALDAAVIQSHHRKIPITSGKTISIKTVIHRLRALNKFYKKFSKQVEKVASPIEDAMDELPQEAHLPPKTVDPKTIEKVFDNLADMQNDEKRTPKQREEIRMARLRFGITATTGKRPAEVGRAVPGDIDFRRRIWTVRGVKFGTTHGITLTDSSVKAWKAFIAANAWGEYTQDGAIFREAGWPEDIRPYNARHSFAKTLLQSGGTIQDVRAQFNHTSERQSRIYGAFQSQETLPTARVMQNFLSGAFKTRKRKKAS